MRQVNESNELLCLVGRIRLQRAENINLIRGRRHNDFAEMKLFIQNIKAREPLWDVKNPDYHNRHKVSKLWDEVAKESDMTREAAVKKFKNLKDTFRREFRKISQSLGTSAPKVTSKWVHYKQLMFLKEILTPRLQKEIPKVENISQQLQVDDDVEKETVGESSPNDMESLSEEKKSSVSYRKVKSKRKAKTDCNFLNFEKSKLDMIERYIETKQDDDHHFLMSFRQYMKKMSDDRKLLFRIKMQEVLYDVLYKNDTPQ